MSKAIILYNFANYYNRKIFRLGTFEDYQALITPADENTPAQYKGLLREDFNFDFNDGVVASKILNIKDNEDIFYSIQRPNYIVIETSFNAGTVEDPSIVKRLTRWYILQCKQIRGKQFQLSLRRDLLADKWDEIMQAPVFIERGNPSIDDPAIFNREGFTYNEIKKNEFLLNNTKLSGKGGGWIVGYLARFDESDKDHPHQDYSISAEGHQTLPPPSQIKSWSSLPQRLQDLLTAGVGYHRTARDISFEFGLKRYTSSSDFRYCTIKVFDNQSGVYTSYWDDNDDFFADSVSFKKYSGSSYFSNSQIISHIKTAYSNYNHDTLAVNRLRNVAEDWYESLNLTDSYKNNYSSYNNTYIVKDNKVYKIKLNYTNQERVHLLSLYGADLTLGSNACAVQFKNFINLFVASGNRVVASNFGYTSDYYVWLYCNDYKITASLELVDFETIEATIPTTRNENLEAPYDLFCIPMGNVGIKNNGSLLFTTMSNSALAMARGIALVGTSAKVFDVQVLPYCPFPELIDSNGDIDIYGYIENHDYSFINQDVDGTDFHIGIILYPPSCRGTFDLDIPSDSDIYEKFLIEDTSAVEKKIKAETENARFVSPNFSAMFDINIQKNNGISRINVDYFLKPYSPYIHVAPYFSGLYGEDYNDPKGLICSGDFSISTAQSQWELYQIQNKNYELIFNRQIENLDVNNSIAYEQAKVSGTINAISNTASNMFSGALAGGVIGAGAGSSGGPYGAVIGAAVGGVAGAGLGAGMGFWGLQKDLELLSKSQKEARSYAEDMYTYNLGNVKALPNSLTRVSSLTENNKIFPFIEFYDCTDEEKEALRNKIKYNGMTVMRIGKISDFIDGDRNYVQGQLIRLEGINEDSHIVSEIANEIKQGAYYYGSNTSES